MHKCFWISIKNFPTLRIKALSIFLLAAISANAFGQTTFKLDAKVDNLLNTYCLNCHDSDVQKGNIRLDNLSDIPLKSRLDLLNRVHEQVYSENMPPKKKKQPTESERITLIEEVAQELKKNKAVKLDDKLRYYQYGNYVNHEKLFSGKIKEKPFTPSRIWRINELIYGQLVRNVLYPDQISKYYGKRTTKKDKGFFGVVKPFNLPTYSGVKYYANEEVENGQFLTLLSNAEWIVEAQLRSALLASGEFKKAYAYLISPGKGFNWPLKSTHPVFSKVIMSAGTPTDSDLQAAIKYQFQVALHRLPESRELQKYLEFTKESIKIGGKAEGLMRMMVAVLMEPEFVNRSEKGDGKLDSHGRSKLTSREASYAIAYALTDRKPDAHLLKAVASKKLNSKADYESEVRRILEDDNIYKPRLLRFFQDYFGYYNIYNIFKDESRFMGSYNPHRVFSRRYIYRAPAKLAVEADLLVEHILKQDKNVLEELLTTEKYIVHHTGDNKGMKKIVDEAVKQEKLEREIYKYLKDHNSWKAYSKKGSKSNQNNVEKACSAKFGKVFRSKRVCLKMRVWKVRFGNDGNKDSGNPLPAIGEAYTHAAGAHTNKVYNINHINWDYPAQQPFKVNNRMGMLTHPAWLISHAQNDHTDPVVRGKWIQDKLLAGFIPDIPITVDAIVPEDHHKTLRERFDVTKAEECWGCHKKMNPLGNPFENFDDFGRYRTLENLEHKNNILKTDIVETGRYKYKKHTYKTKPVNSTGYLKGTGNNSLDGEVKDYKDLLTRLAKSKRVRQSFVRHVFRYFMGRNEMLSDSQTLIEADKAYVSSGGSFKELVVSLLTSDSFIYRKDTKKEFKK